MGLKENASFSLPTLSRETNNNPTTCGQHIDEDVTGMNTDLVLRNDQALVIDHAYHFKCKILKIEILGKRLRYSYHLNPFRYSSISTS